MLIEDIVKLVFFADIFVALGSWALSSAAHFY
jgi:hypothetical protein